MDEKKRDEMLSQIKANTDRLIEPLDRAERAEKAWEAVHLEEAKKMLRTIVPMGKQSVTDNLQKQIRNLRTYTIIIEIIQCIAIILLGISMVKK